MIREFANLDGRTADVTTNAQLVRETLTAADPPVRFVIAEADGVAAGFASFYGTYSTASARRRLWLEDLYVREPWQRRGVGRALMRHVAGVAIASECTAIDWSVGAENQDALAFYASVGAPVRERTRLCRMKEAAITAPVAGYR